MTKYACLAGAYLTLWVGFADAQEASPPGGELGARQLFFLNVEKTPPKTGAARATAKRTAAVAKQPKEPPLAVQAGRDTKRPPSPAAGPNRARDEAALVNAAASKPMIGLRYSLIQVSANGNGTEVPTDTVFRTGDRVRVKLEANRPGYLYVVQQGSSGRWDLLYPTAQMQPLALEAMQPVTIPSGDNVFEFDEKPGTEQLFIVLSSQPEEKLEELLRSVRPREKKESMQLATARLPVLDADEFQSVRDRLVSRDLKVEKVSGSSSAGAENAVYVVAAAEGGRVSTPLTLEHR